MKKDSPEYISLLAEYRAKDAKKEIEREEVRASKVRIFNNRNGIKKDLLKRILDLDLPAENILCKDGSLNLSKAKKVSGLTELFENDRIKLIYDETERVYHMAKIGSQRFYLRFPDYNTPGVTTYKKFETFEAACDHNNFRLTNLTLAQVKRNAAKLKKAAEKIAEQIAKYDKLVESTDAYFLERETFLQRTDKVARVYDIK